MEEGEEFGTDVTEEEAEASDAVGIEDVRGAAGRLRLEISFSGRRGGRHLFLCQMNFVLPGWLHAIAGCVRSRGPPRAPAILNNDLLFFVRMGEPRVLLVVGTQLIESTH